jgi:hypothetical protein
MTFSFSRLTLCQSDSAMYKIAIEILEDRPPQTAQLGTASCIGEVDNYRIWLGFRKGIPSWKCSCAQAISARSNNPCVHVIVLSIAWDRSRKVPDPTAEDTAFLS